jgi:hypothetical protein
VQVTPAWFTATVWPATVKVPVRPVVDVLAATVTVMVALPLPLLGEVVTNAGRLPTDHVQVLPVVIDSVVLPPPAPIVRLVGVTE